MRWALRHDRRRRQHAADPPGGSPPDGAAEAPAAATAEEPGAAAPPPRAPLTWRAILRRAAIGCVAAALAAVAFIAVSFAVLARSVPEIATLADYHPPLASKLFDRRGELLFRYFRERRTVVPLERIPEHVKRAFLAAEDASFYQHQGLDYMAILRAAFDELTYRVFGGRRSGGSTITQQTARTFFLSTEQTYTRKLREMILAKKIEENFGKDEILFLYLNQIYFGHGAYGVEEAAKEYYGVSVQDLTLGQAAALASIPKSPNRINPSTNPTRVAKRRDYVLQQMLEQNWATPAEVERAKGEPVRVEFDRPAYQDLAAYPAETIRRELEARFGSEQLLAGGLRIYTTLDGAMQAAAQQALREGLRAIDRRQGFRGPLLRLEPDEMRPFVQALHDAFDRHHAAALELTAADASLLGRPVWDLSALDPKRVLESPKSAAEAVPTRKLREKMLVGGLVERVDSTADVAIVDLGSVKANLPLAEMQWARPFAPLSATPTPRDPADVLRPGDVVLVRVLRENVAYKGKLDPDADANRPPPPVGNRTLTVTLEQIPRAQGALVALDPNRHTVLAMTGGYDFLLSSFDRATQARRQPGSAFKPIVYAAGIASRSYTAASLLTDAPKVYRDASTGKTWKPENYDGRFRGDITLRECLTHSVNMCSIQILDRVGVDGVIDLARQLGIQSPLPASLTLALGSGDVTPFELANAYATIASGGLFQAPVLIEHVKSNDGQLLLEASYEQSEALDPNVAYAMTHIMQSVVESGTAQRAKALDRPVAGKTGTSNEQRNAWFVGFTPDLVATVYVGFDDNAPLGRGETGSRAALPIWVSFMEQAVKLTPKRDFQAPDGVIFVRVNKNDGLRTEPTDPDGIDEVFLEGTEPTGQHDLAGAPPSLFMHDGAPDL
ncbi:MAG: PBP1A family penicillin-binding protein [Deltaproteobacteria bacterium]|nr:PBP1A family penicillin-binding protein [Deltaproteobacteria bacterium]